jgi:hypothetical protein
MRKLTPWSTAHIEKLIVTLLLRKFCLLWNPKINYLGHKGLPLVPILEIKRKSVMFLRKIDKICF